MSLLVVVRLKVVSNKVWPDKMMLAALNFIFANRNKKPSLSSNQENKKATKTISLCHLIIPRTRGKYQHCFQRESRELFVVHDHSSDDVWSFIIREPQHSERSQIFTKREIDRIRQGSKMFYCSGLQAFYEESLSRSCHVK